MKKSMQMEIEHDCTALIVAFSHYLDHDNYEALAALFVPEGSWTRNGVRLEGRAQILAALQQRPSQQVSRHITTNIHFTHVDEHQVNSAARNLTYFSLHSKDLPALYQPENVLVLDFIDTFVNTAEGWRFKQRNTPITMLTEQVRAMMSNHK